MRNIITRFGIPHTFVTDNGPQFISQELRELCDRYGIALHHSSPYYPQGNGQAEATNKTLIKIVKKTCEGSRFSDWPEKLVNALWAYR
ncbi:DDE-type integrase/transposase/recombinase, partial [Klebsiella pneumoniae]|uniref:DDE-type integrase/transposase/recombinase n=1 Tax=Klebsiella pneumoniae TaxID=573 RepID=UPI0038FC3585